MYLRQFNSILKFKPRIIINVDRIGFYVTNNKSNSSSFGELLIMTRETHWRSSNLCQADSCNKSDETNKPIKRQIKCYQIERLLLLLIFFVANSQISN